MESGIIQEKPINLTGSETTKQNDIDSGSKDENNRNYMGDNNQRNDLIYPNHMNGEKMKRHRRRNSEIAEKAFQCPDCDKCYLSGPALTTHRKTKHGYGFNGEIKMRGRPKKEGFPENPTQVAQHKFNIFFQNETRKPPSLDQTMNEKTISLDIIKNNLNDIFRQCQNELFKNYEKVDDYCFYNLIIKNWEKEKPDIEEECYYDDNQKNSDVPLKKINSPCVDGLFYLYLREFSKKTNKDYFWFLIKFVVLFREFINQKKSEFVRKDIITDDKKEYSQIFNAESIPDICNDYYIEFMEPHNFFGLNQDELIEVIQHFCYWLYSNKYTQAHLYLLQN
jgi:hypothetical protein